MKPNVSVGKRIKVDLVKMGIVSKKPKPKTAPVLGPTQRDTRVK